VSSPVKNPSRKVPEDAKHWRFEEVGDAPPVPLEEAWGSGKEPIEGKQLRGRAVLIKTATGRAESAPEVNPSLDGDTVFTGDEDQDREGRSNTFLEEDPPSLGEGEGSLSDQDNNNPNTGTTDNINPGASASEEEYESEGEVENSLFTTGEPIQTKNDVEIDPEEGDGVVEANNGFPERNRHTETSEEDGWKPAHRRTSAPVFGPLASPVILSKERYCPKGF